MQPQLRTDVDAVTPEMDEPEHRGALRVPAAAQRMVPEDDGRRLVPEIPDGVQDLGVAFVHTEQGRRGGRVAVAGEDRQQRGACGGIGKEDGQQCGRVAGVAVQADRPDRGADPDVRARHPRRARDERPAHE